MSEPSGQLNKCGKCNSNLPTPTPNFCGVCGCPQRKMKSCLNCHKMLPDLGNFCVHCGHDQRLSIATKVCISCKCTLDQSAQFCSNCGQSQSSDMSCTLCGNPVVDSWTRCPICSAYVDRVLMKNVGVVSCVNTECQTSLMVGSINCYKCKATQQTPVHTDNSTATQDVKQFTTPEAAIDPNTNSIPKEQDSELHVSKDQSQIVSTSQVTSMVTDDPETARDSKEVSIKDSIIGMEDKDTEETVANMKDKDTEETVANMKDKDTEEIVNDMEDKDTEETVADMEVDIKESISLEVSKNEPHTEQSTSEMTFEESTSSSVPDSASNIVPDSESKLFPNSNSEKISKKRKCDEELPTTQEPSPPPAKKMQNEHEEIQENASGFSSAVENSEKAVNEGVKAAITGDPESGTSPSPDPEYSTPPSSPNKVKEELTTVENVKTEIKQERPTIAYKKDESNEVLFDGTKGRKKENEQKDKNSVNTGKIKPVIWKDPPQGLVKGRRSHVQFHAILPTMLWEWDDDSEVYVRFGHPKLGDWQCDCGPMKVVKNAGNGFLILFLDLQISSEILRSYVPYKYTVYSPLTVQNSSDKDTMYEYINANVGISSDYANRLLLPDQSKEHHCIYDCIICPRTPKTSSSKPIATRAMNFFKGFFSDSDEATDGSMEKDVSFATDIYVMRKTCLQLYLKEEFFMITRGEVNTDITWLIDKIISVLHCLFSMSLHDGSSKRKGNFFLKKWDCPKFVQETKQDILLLIQKCKTIDKADGGVGQMVSACVVTYCLHKFFALNDLKMPFIRDILELFILKIDVDHKSCPGVEFLLSQLPLQFRDYIQRHILLYCNRLLLAEQSLNDLFVIFNGLTVHHLLSNSNIKLFSELEKKPNEWNWSLAKKDNFNVLLICRILDKVSVQDFKHLITSLRPLFSLNQHVLLFFLSCCNLNQCKHMFDAVPQYFLIARVTKCMVQNRGLDQPAVKGLMELNQLILNEEPIFPKPVKCLKEAISQLQMASSTIRLYNTEAAVPFLVSSVCLLLNAISYCLDGDNNHQLCDVAYTALSTCLKSWFNKEIGEGFGHAFRTTGYITRSQLNKSLDEFKMWNSFFGASCPSGLKTKYEYILLSIIKGRISKFNCDEKIELLVVAEKLEVTNAVVTLFLEEISNSLEEDMLTKQSGSQSVSIAKLQTSLHVADLLGNMLHKKYPKFAENISIEDILEWRYWPIFIQIYVNSKGLSDTDSNICGSAIAVFNSVSESLGDGSIKMEMLKVLKSKEEEFQNVLSALYQPSSSKENSLAQTQSMFTLRLKEYKYFTQYKQNLQYLCHHLNGLNIKGLDSLLNELKSSFDDHSISNLCATHNGTVSVICFEAASPLNVVLKKFVAISQENLNDFFHNYWNKQKNCLLDQTINFNDVVTIVWDKTFNDCASFIQSLRDRSILLSEVEDLLLNYKKKSNLVQNIKNLESGVCCCIDKPIGEQGWIDGCVSRMYQYNSLSNHASTATTFLQLKKMLQLEGDFSLVENLADEFTQSVKSKSLEYITDSVVETGKFLSGISSNIKKLNCLQVFLSCQSIVKWIQTETRDVNDLQNFVTIALATAVGGEDELSRDRLVNLRTVGKGFAALIYHVPKTLGYKELESRCKSIWEALSLEGKLPKLMEDCNALTAWYQLVKDTQGSVEKSSFDKMKNVKAFGTYTIGSQSVTTHSCLKDVIRLELNSSTRDLAQRNYTLDDLRDLESKLVLITSQDSQERFEVDHFIKTFNSICRIGEILIELQQHGQDDYMGWEVKVCCRVMDVVSKLGDLAKQMEHDLGDWKTTVSKERQHFYHLNYFTAQQLLALRKDLHCYRDSSSKVLVNPETLALLQSISRNVTEKNVFTVLNKIHSKQATKIRVSEKENVFQSNIVSNEVESMIVESTSDLPEPRLLFGDLSDVQKSILFNLKQSCGFHSKLVLLAFDKCTECESEKAIQSWCIENQQNFPYKNIDDDSSDTVSVKSGDFSMEALPTTSLTINEHHPTVKQFIDSGIDKKLAINAVKQYPDDPVAAMNYCLTEEENGFFDISDETADHLFGESHQMFAEKEPLQSDDNDPPSLEYTSIESQDSMEISVDDIEFVHAVTSSSKNYLSLLELGTFLDELDSIHGAPVNQMRPVPDGIKVGECNLVVVSADDVLKTVMSFYMKGSNLPLPTPEEVVLCSQQTTVEEVSLLWKRAIHDPDKYRIFCLVHAEKLSYHVCDRAIKELNEVMQGKTDYRLIIVCSNEGQDKSHIVSRLQLYKRSIASVYSSNEISRYLIKHFTKKEDVNRGVAASDIDLEQSYVRVVRSERPGMGKSHYVSTLEQNLKRKLRSNDGSSVAVIPVHGPHVTPDSIIDHLKKCGTHAKPTIYHFDIAPGILYQMDTILFNITVLQSLYDSKGRVWRCNPSHNMYAIEVTIQKSHDVASKCVAFLDLLPSIRCVSPRTVLVNLNAETQDKYVQSIDTNEFKSHMFQRVFQYLRRHIGRLPLDSFKYQLGSVESTPKIFLEVLLGQCGIRDPSWTELKNFIQFLDIQLKASEKSIFCNEAIVGDVMSGFKTFVVRFMIRMSKDFATSSLKGEVALENEEAGIVGDDQDLEEYQIDDRKQWEQSYHPYLFFNEDSVSITFVGFNVSSQGDLLDPTTQNVIERAAMAPNLYSGIQKNGVNLTENYRFWEKLTMIQKIGMVMGLEWMTDPDGSYVLTADNVIKVLAIHMRFRCNIPVVIMGETGCGKTRLIRYMCDVAAQCCRQGGESVRNMFVLKIHGGTTEEDIEKSVIQAEAESLKNRQQHNLDTVLFFDEANTTEAIGFIKEIMCDRRINGRPVKDDVKFIAACNPYKKHSKEMIEKLESAGLGFYVKAVDPTQMLGKIPLRQLVYRVLDLPPSMKPLVYDFGQLNDSTEKDYTEQIVKGRCSSIHGIKDRSDIINCVSNVLSWCQSYMRKRKDECSFVSLRDVERAMIVFKYFCEKAEIFQEMVTKSAEQEGEQVSNVITRALILAVSVCYHARLQEREEFEKLIVNQFLPPLTCNTREQFKDELRWTQQVLLNNMKLGSNIARNAALRENVFMMVVCIELRIPLFLVGKPGSSKSLAKSIVTDSMLGSTSELPLLKAFKEVQMFSYQCSQLSTPESVIEVFNTAMSIQKKKDTSNFVSVVVLDEVGLAEDSPNLPLKALHPLLEDGTQGGDNNDMSIEREKRVAFIGISNWALDPAKMNRGVMVTRGDPSENELVSSAKGICSNRENDIVKGRLEPYFKPLASAYKEICSMQEEKKRAFFGLRDFYSLIKMLYWMCEKCNCPPTGKQLEHAIRRNFGGYFNTYEIFIKHIGNLNLNRNEDTAVQMKHLLSPDCSPLGLIKTSVSSRDITWHGENRYLLFLTENYAALEVIKHYLGEVIGIVSDEDVADKQHKLAVVKREPFILFGSSFPKDLDYTQVCRNINQIKLCMETGRTVILLNLENLYESLYDLLNQYYIVHGDIRYVDLGLQSHRVKCRVHNDFKLILIAEKETVYEKFPTPLINRLEKHFVLTTTVLSDWQKDVLEILETWIHDFSVLSTSTSKFSAKDVFVGFQDDTPASVVFQATEQLKTEVYYDWREEESRFKEDVYDRSCNILLQMATPDALIRLKKTNLSRQNQILKTYFHDQCHDSLVEFLDNQILPSEDNGIVMQVTTQSHLLSDSETNELSKSINMEIYCFLLQEFDTELDFSNKISHAFTDDNKAKLLILQCDSGHLYSDLIACARYRIDDEKERARYMKSCIGITHVLFLVNLPRKHSSEQSSKNDGFVGFKGGSWISAHIDDIRQPSQRKLTLKQAQAPINELFYNMGFGSRKDKIIKSDIFDHVGLEEDSEMLGESMEVQTDNHLQVTAKDPMGDAMELQQSDSVEVPRSTCYPQCHKLYEYVQAAVAEAIKGTSNLKKDHAAQRVRLLLDLIPEDLDLTHPLDDSEFYGALVKHIRQLLKERDELYADSDWVLDEAMNARNLHNGGTFQNVLSRRIDQVVIPLFSAIIVYMDHYYNLSLLLDRQQNIGVYKLWMTLFTNCKLFQLRYEQIALGNISITEGNTSQFSCQFPFFWLIKETIDAKWNLAISATELRSSLHSQLCDLLKDDPLAEVLSTVNHEHVVELAKCYAHDYLRCMHTVLHDQKSNEYKIILNELLAIVDGSSDFSVSLLEKIIAIHVVYDSFHQEITLLGQLTAHVPGILVRLSKMTGHSNGEEFQLHLIAAEVALEYLFFPPDYDTKDLQAVNSKLRSIQKCQNVIDSILSLSSNDFIYKLRCSWHSIKVLQLFIEHVVTKNSLPLLQFLKLFSTIKICDFTKVSTLKRIMNALSIIDKSAKTRGSTVNLKKSCNSFFMEVVSLLCLGQPQPPEEALIKELLRIVVSDKNQTRKLTYAEKVEKVPVDEVPVVRSFLFQLLMEHNSEIVKSCLNHYITKTRTIVNDDENLCLLCIRCLEDSFHRQFSDITLKSSMKKLIQMFRDGIKEVSKIHLHSFAFSLQFFEGVAKLRYVLVNTADLIYSELNGKTDEMVSHELHCLLDEVKQCCVSKTYNSEDVGPGVFLLKQIYKKYGKAFLMGLSVNPVLEWIVPKHLRSTEEQLNVSVDHFVFHKFYNDMRSLFIDVAYGSNIDKMRKELESTSSSIAIPFVLALYQVVTLSKQYSDETRQVDIRTRNCVGSFTSGCSFLSKPLKRICQILLRDMFCFNLNCMIPSPSQSIGDRLLTDLVIHTVIVFIGNKDLDVLLPFINILENPGQLKNAYLPTMPEDSLPNVRKAMGGHFYECPQGHPYFVSECGRPVQEYTCPTCSCRIGGLSHKLLTTNRDARTTDITERGYCLGLPEKRTSTAHPERSLTPVACMVIRVFLHCVLIWSSSDETLTEGLLDLLKSKIRPVEISMFFWNHLKKDISTLSHTTGKSQDEMCLILHMILQDISVKPPPSSSGMKTYATLLAREGRDQWEQYFNNSYIQPTIRRLDHVINEGTQCLLNNTRQDCDRLFYTVYEKKAVKQGIVPSLWTYRSQITLEQLSQVVKNSKSYSILTAFLDEEHILRATKYIPDIVKIQSQLHRKFNRRMDRSEATQLTIENYISTLESDFKQDTFRNAFHSFQKAMDLVKTDLLKHARVRVSPQYLDVVWDMHISLEYLIPTLTGPGTCTVALLDLLVYAHNNFMDLCHSKLSTGLGQKVPISLVQECHLMNHEYHLMPIILSHCHYSLTYGHGQEIDYDLQALEKHLVDRFVHGKPHLQLEIPQVVFRKDVYAASTFANIRKKVKPQVKIDDKQRYIIIDELKTNQNLREALDVIEIVMGFVASSGNEDSQKPLKKYLNTALNMQTDRIKSKMALEFCCLKHILSLWESLSVEMARRLTVASEEPFDSIPKEFLIPMGETEGEQLNEFLHSIDVNPFLGLMYEFIETFVRNLEPFKSDWPLLDIFEVYFQQYLQIDLPGEYTKNFPELTVGHAVSCWKEILQYQIKYEANVGYTH